MGHRRRSGGARLLGDVGLLVCVAVVVAAPIVAGGVHRASMIALLVAGALGLAGFAVGLWRRGGSPRVGSGVVLPLAFLVVPVVQSIPLPFSVRALLDRAGSALLQDNQIVATSGWPLSLDPPSTRADIGRAALALMAFLLAYHLASGKSRRQLLTRAIGIAGIAAVVIGLGHRILGFTKLYGTFAFSPRSLLIGPFVNSNHTAEFLELSVFVCLACSLQRRTALNRIGWLVGMILCAGGAAATLSRGAVVALTMAVVMFMFLRYFVTDDRPAGRRRASLAWGALILGLVVLGAGALGAGQLIDRFKTDAVTTDVRFQLWREGLRVFAVHPFGIGRDAFDRVFPVYRSLKMAFPIRFAFVECEPLQLLIDCGWLFFLLLVAAGALVVWQIVRRGRRDKTEAALVAGLFAVLVHSTVDFGFETLGVLLPFMAILGTVLGRLDPARAQEPVPAPPSPRARWLVFAAAGAGMVVGVLSIAHRSYDDFDALLKKPMTPVARQALVIRAEETHPLDYLYALGDARLVPLKPLPGKPSPRLHALNRALRLCPSCEVIHTEVARNLWRMGLRRQAILEWRTAVDIQPLLFVPMCGELYAEGAKPEDLAAIAAPNGSRLTYVAEFLSAQQRIPDAFVVLDQADALGAPAADSLLMRARLQLQAGRLSEAASTLERVKSAGASDPRLAVLQSQLLISTKGADGADSALAILDGAATRFPTDPGVQRERVALVTRFEKWNAVTRSIEGLERALYQATGSATEAHVASARINGQMGHWTKALDEYRIALAADGRNVPLWIEYARAAERIGHDQTARDAYAQAAGLSPNSPDIASPLHELDVRQARLRSLVHDPPDGIR